jgi:hypothetical protein
VSAADLGARLRGRLARAPVVAVALGIAVVAGVALRLYRFDAPILDSHGFRQTQTASEIWLWDHLGFDFFSYHVPMLGAGHWVLEFPVYQLVVWLLTHVGLGIEPAGRIVSIASYVASAALLYVLGARATGSRVAAAAAVAVFSVLPVTVFYYRTVMIDPFLIALVLTATLLMAWAGARFTWWRWAAFSAVFVVALLGKPTLTVALGGPMLVIGVRMLLDRGAPVARRLAPVGTALVAAALLAAWNRHGMLLNKASGSDWASGNPDWYFGTTFTSTTLWSTLFDRIESNFQIVGTALVVLGLLAIPRVRTGRRPELVALVAGGFLFGGIFANLNTIHDYYQLPLYVPLSLFAGMGIALLHDGISRVSPHGPAIATAAAAVLVVGLAIAWSRVLWDGYYGPAAVIEAFRGQAIELANATPPRGRLLLLQENADKYEPMVWFEARRTGWRVPVADRAEATRIARTTPDLSGIAFLRGAAPEPPYVARLAAGRGFARTFESPAMVVYTRPG